MTSEVEICNLALSNIRGGSINSLTESSVQAQNCKLKYPLMRDQLMRDAPWQFAHKIKALALLTDELFNWANVYQYPSDCLQINRLLLNFEEVESGNALSNWYYDPALLAPNPDRQVKYQIYNTDDNRVIGANETELRIDYRAKITDPNLFDSQFVIMFSYLLSSELAIPIVGGKLGREFRADSLKIYQQYYDAAVASNENEQYIPPAESDFVTIRS